MDPQLAEGRFGAVTQTDIVRFAGAGGDFNPLHHDPAFAERAGFDVPIAMGQFTIALMSSWLTDQIGVENLRSLDVDFKAPVKIGDTVSFSAEYCAPESDDSDTETAERPGSAERISTVKLTAAVDDATVVSGRATFSADDAADYASGMDSDRHVED